MLSFKSAEYDLDYDNDMTTFLRDYGVKLPAITLTPPEATDDNLTSGQASALANMLAQNTAMDFEGDSVGTQSVTLLCLGFVR